MSADITEKDGKQLVAVNWDRGNPWHMLGEQVDHDMGREEALALVGVLNEEIRHKDLWTVADTATTARFTVKGVDEPWIRVKDLEKVDNDVAVGINSTEFGTISTASKGYHPIQRRDLLQIAYDIVGLGKQEDKDTFIDTIGNLGPRGDTFFAYIRVPDIVIDPGGVADVIENGLFVATSYNQSLANTLGWSPIRPVCRNTVTMGLGGLQQAIRARHTKNSEERIKQAAVALQYIGAVEEEMIKRAEEMLKIDGHKAMKTVLDHFYDVNDEGLGDKAKTTRLRQRNTIINLLNGKDNTTSDLVGFNGYAAFQAFVEFKDHESDVKGKGQVAQRTRARNAVLPGKTVDDKIKASDLILALAA